MAKVIGWQDIKTAGSCRYDEVALGEVMLRLDPRDVPVARMRDAVRVFQGGGETNVACGLAYTFGLRTAVLTALVEDGIGANIRNQLHNGINFTYKGVGILQSEAEARRAAAGSGVKASR
jgi:2-dehydro-3-deoxygluconokinase